MKRFLGAGVFIGLVLATAFYFAGLQGQKEAHDEADLQQAWEDSVQAAEDSLWEAIDAGQGEADSMEAAEADSQP